MWIRYRASGFLLAIALGLPSVLRADGVAGETKVSSTIVSNPFLDLFLLTQHVGRTDAIQPAADNSTKVAIARALKGNKALTVTGASPFMNAETFSRLAGSDGELDSAEIQRALVAQIPASRQHLFPKLADHLTLLSTSLDLIDAPHRATGQELVDWIVENYSPSKPMGIVCVCTGNSRRSMLMASMVNATAAYYGLSDIHGYSGGTKPSAFNSRSITTLRGIGFEIQPTGKEAPRGDEATANPIYTVSWGTRDKGGRLETTEFSKRYDDPHNPQSGFAALMVCSEADAECPSVSGAAKRIAMPYLDPKTYDDTSIESQKYAERRDDIGRLMVSVMMQARLRLIAAGKLDVIPTSR
jgi:arsenate reductase (thioredoxin)